MSMCNKSKNKDIIILFSVYLNDLIDILRSSNIGCRYGNYYMGVYC